MIGVVYEVQLGHANGGGVVPGARSIRNERVDFTLKRSMVTETLSAQGKMRVWCRRLLAGAVCVITVGSIIPYGSGVSTVSIVSVGLDKILHVLAFACVMVLAFGAGRELTVWYGMRSVMYVLIFGAGIECVQYYIPYRTFNPVDIMANLFGIVFGVLLWIFGRKSWCSVG